MYLSQIKISNASAFSDDISTKKLSIKQGARMVCKDIIRLYSDAYHIFNVLNMGESLVRPVTVTLYNSLRDKVNNMTKERELRMFYEEYSVKTDEMLTLVYEEASRKKGKKMLTEVIDKLIDKLIVLSNIYQF